MFPKSARVVTSSSGGSANDSSVSPMIDGSSVLRSTRVETFSVSGRIPNRINPSLDSSVYPFTIVDASNCVDTITSKSEACTGERKNKKKKRIDTMDTVLVKDIVPLYDTCR